MPNEKIADPAEPGHFGRMNRAWNRRHRLQHGGPPDRRLLRTESEAAVLPNIWARLAVVVFCG